jgi:hypothetical protein
MKNPMMTGATMKNWMITLALLSLLGGCGDEGPTAVKKVTVGQDATAADAGDASVTDAGTADGEAVDVPTDTVAGLDAASDGAIADTGAADVAADVTAVVDAADTTAADGISDSAADTAADAAQSCSGPGGCYACPPKSNAELLNQCTNHPCAPFDNVKRLPLLGAGGKLPPLP